MSEAIAALAGVALGAVFTLVRDWLNGRRADRLREAHAAAERVRFERDIVGELLVGLHLWVTSVANRKQTARIAAQVQHAQVRMPLGQHRTGGQVGRR